MYQWTLNATKWRRTLALLTRNALENFCFCFPLWETASRPHECNAHSKRIILRKCNIPTHCFSFATVILNKCSKQNFRFVSLNGFSHVRWPAPSVGHTSKLKRTHRGKCHSLSDWRQSKMWHFQLCCLCLSGHRRQTHRWNRPLHQKTARQMVSIYWKRMRSGKRTFSENSVGNSLCSWAPATIDSG